MAEQNLRDWMFGLLGIAFISTALFAIIFGIIGGEDGTGTAIMPQDEANRLNNSLYYLNDFQETNTELRENIENIVVPTNVFEAASFTQAVFGTIMGILKLIINSISLLNGFIGSILVELMLPSWISGFVTTAILFIILFSILSLWFGRDA